MKKQQFWFVILAWLLTTGELLTGCAGCAVTMEAEADSGLITIMTWNIHNLFDGEDNGYEYDEFLHSSGWSAEKYRGRINTISDAIGRIEPDPDIILLQEIESLRVLEDIARSLENGYSHSHFAVNPGSAIGLGIISKYPLLDAKAHSVTINNDTAPRPVLEARIQTRETKAKKNGSNKNAAVENVSQSNNPGNSLVIFACHWKSKLGGDEATESTRRASARVILRRIHELRENEPDLGIIIAGDLNQNHDEFYRQNASMICALLPDDPYSSLLVSSARVNSNAQKDFIVISKNTPPVPVNFPRETITFYSPWIKELENGSYFYKNNWETIDHFLISSQLFNNTETSAEPEKRSFPSGWEYEKTIIVNIAPFANPSGIPKPYNSRTGLGMSDHLPLMLFLRMRE